MGQAETAPAIAAGEVPSLHEFLNLCAETDLTCSPYVQAWGLAWLKKGDFQARWRVSKIFPRFGSVMIDPLLEIAEDGNQEMELRWFAIRILGQYKDPEAIARLILLLDACNDEYLIDEIMNALTQLQAKATDYLIPLLKEAESRLLAVKALNKIRHPNVVDPLLSVVDDDNSEIRAIALEALSSFRHPKIFAVLTHALRDNVSQVRLEAVRALGFWSNYADRALLLEQISPLLYDLDLHICSQAAFSLGRLQTPEAATAIATVLQSPATPLPLQRLLVQAMGWMDVPNSLLYLGHALQQEVPELTLEILKMLGRISESHRQKQAIPILLEFWRNTSLKYDPQIRQALSYTLGQLQEPQCRPLLMSLAQDPDDKVKLQATVALQKLPVTE